MQNTGTSALQGREHVRLHRAMEHCRKAHDNNCVMDVGDHDGIPCNAENCIAYREVVEAIKDAKS